MTMVVKIEVSGQAEEQLLIGLSEKNERAIRQILVDALDSTVESLMHGPQDQTTLFTREKWEHSIAQLTEIVSASTTAPLPDEAITREGIYGEHP